jgi:hypothetical protein
MVSCNKPQFEIIRKGGKFRIVKNKEIMIGCVENIDM